MDVVSLVRRRLLRHRVGRQQVPLIKQLFAADDGCGDLRPTARAALTSQPADHG